MDDAKASAKARADLKSDHAHTPVGSGGHTPGGGNNDHKKLKPKSQRGSFVSEGNRSAASSVPNSHPNSARGQQTAGSIGKLDISHAFKADDDDKDGSNTHRSEHRKTAQPKRGSGDNGTGGGSNAAAAANNKSSKKTTQPKKH